MKLAIVSDLHIGYERFYSDACTQAKEALESANEAADAILIPGDIFDKRNPKPEVIAQAVNIFRELNAKPWKAKVRSFSPFRKEARAYTDSPIIAIPGTHERVAEGKENPLTVLALAGLLVDASESTVTLEKEGEKVSVFGLGGLSEERVKSTLEEIAPKPVESSFNVFMFHQSTYELLPFSEHFIHYDELPKGFDLYVDGHIHTKLIGKIHGKPFLIPGSTVLTQQKENEQEPKGFFIYDTKSNSSEFRHINSRPFISVKLKFDGAPPDEVIRSVEQELQRIIKQSKEKPIIRLRIEGSISKGFHGVDLQLRTIRSRFATAAFLDIEQSIEDIGTEKEIEQIREGRLDGLSIKELGMGIFNKKLKEGGFSAGINPAELFEALSIKKKEKALKEASSLFEEG